MILWGGGQHAHVNICWTIQIILKHFDSHFAPFHQIFIKFYFLSDWTHIFHFTFLSKFKNACKYVKLALKYQTIKRGGFLFNTL